MDTATNSAAFRRTTVSSYFPSSGYVSCIAVDPRDGNKVMAVFSNYEVYSIFYSEDAGTTWIKGAGNLEQSPLGTGNGPSCRWAAILPQDSGKTTYFVGTSVGLFATDTIIGTISNSSTVWVQQGATEIGNAVVDMIDVRTSDKAILVGTHGYGMFTANMATQPGFNAIRSPEKTSLAELKNYPNPFSENTHIEITLPYRSKVLLKIWNVQGRVVAVLKNEEMTGGKHTIVFNGKNLTAGIYFCNLETGQFQKTISLVKIGE